ncbi:MAG: hypothetical protein ABEJ89_08615 [Haloarculaceae archaeon]
MSPSDPGDPSALDGGGDALVVAPRVRDATDDRWQALAGAAAPPERVVGVSIGRSPTALRAAWCRGPNEPSCSFVTVADATRSAASASVGTLPGATVTAVPSVRPLSRFAEAITDQLGDREAETVVSVHSITDLLEYADRETVFRFLHALASSVRATRATGYYHLDAVAHDAETVARFGTLFDAVVELDDGR